MKRAGLAVGLTLSIAGAMLACGSSRLAAPPYVAQSTGALQPTDFPPPPARVEYVPDEPAGGEAVWIDGEWTWQGQRYTWKSGRWVIPPPKAKFSPWSATRDVAGVLYVAPGTWRDGAGNEVAEPEPLASGRRRPFGDGGGGGAGRRTPPVVPDGGAPSDAGLVDVALSDAMAHPDALPLPSP
jgi:hypothetical protein